MVKNLTNAIIPANILRVSNIEYVRPSIIGSIGGYAYDGNNAISL